MTLQKFKYKNFYRYLLFAMIGSLFFIQANAQRNRETEQHPVRQTQNPRTETQQPPRNHNIQNPQQTNNPKPVHQQPHVNNSPQLNNGGNNPPPPKPRPVRQQPHINNAPVTPPSNPAGNNNASPRPRPVHQQPHVNNNVPAAPRQTTTAPVANNNNTEFRHGNNRPIQAERRPNHYWPQQSYNAHNPGWRYAHLPRRNTIITSFSFPYQTIYFGGYNYRYCDGVYYRPYNNVFMVIAPPFGLYINILPFGYRRIFVNDYPYYYYNGTYYDEYEEESYRVVAPPVGAIVESIPEGYETIVIDGETYYKVDNVQYKPVVQDNGEIWYQVIKVG